MILTAKLSVLVYFVRGECVFLCLFAGFLFSSHYGISSTLYNKSTIYLILQNVFSCGFCVSC